jgi:hypothetical protein
MAHYAKVEDGIVTQVIVADTAEWCEANLGGEWIQTSYNTHGGVNNREGGTPIHKNYAGIGYTFDGTGFAAPKPYESWTLNADSYLWEAPTPKPEDDKLYTWNEEDLAWVEVILTPAEVVTP